MLKFNTIELINKIIGFIITALLARILTNEFGTYLYYQTIFGYLYAFALFSSDYNFLVNYKSDKSFIGSKAYYQTLFIKLLLVVLINLITLFFIMPRFTAYAFWPYLISITSSLFVYDFVLYIEDDKKGLIIYRFLSQVTTLACVMLFYFQLINSYYITIVQTAQTLILTFGTYVAASKYIPRKVERRKFIESINELSLKHFGAISSYFLFRNFIVFFTSIELVFLSYMQMIEERNVFAEGLRLSGILTPFALFYINFNINKINKGYHSLIITIAIFLLFLSPGYVLAFMGETFIDKIYLYNFFIWVFVFNAFLEKDYVEYLTQDHHKKKELLIYNIFYFIISSLLFLLIIQTPIQPRFIIAFFCIKLLLYYVLFIRKFKLKLHYAGLATAFLAIMLLNQVLFQLGYYTITLKYLVQIKKALL